MEVTQKSEKGEVEEYTLHSVQIFLYRTLRFEPRASSQISFTIKKKKKKIVKNVRIIKKFSD